MQNPTPLKQIFPKEDLLYFIWKNRLIEVFPLKLVSGESIQIIQPGFRNFNSGPDFLQARIQLGPIQLVGNIEFHVKSSDWYKHKHEKDRGFDSVILHVVYQYDQKVLLDDGFELPVLEMKNYLDTGLLSRYQFLQLNQEERPCHSINPIPGRIELEQWTNRLAIERMEEKYERICLRLKESKNHWEEVFFKELLRSFCGSLNSNGAEALNAKIDFGLVLRYREQQFTFLAYVWGIAGFLEEKGKGNLAIELRKTWLFLCDKHRLEPIPVHLWKFSKTRPANFPSNRLLQFALFYRHEKVNLFYYAALKNPKMISTSIEQILFNRLAEFPQISNGAKWTKTGKAGKEILNRILVNTLAPMLFTLGKQRGDVSLQELGLEIWNQCPGEVNHQTKYWKSRGWPGYSALDTQAMLIQNQNYCSKKNCLSCIIGQYFINPKTNSN